MFVLVTRPYSSKHQQPPRRLRDYELMWYYGYRPVWCSICMLWFVGGCILVYTLYTCDVICSLCLFCSLHQFLSQGPTLTRYRSAAANVIIDIGGGGVASAPKNLSRRRLELFLISGGGVHISEWWVFWNISAALLMIWSWTPDIESDEVGMKYRCALQE